MKLYLRVAMKEEKLSELKKYFDEIIYDPWTITGERYYENEMLEKLKKIKPDVVITELDRITKKVLEGYKGLKLIGDCRANPANIDVEACNRFKIPIICTPARNAQAVAELLVGLVICYLRNVMPAIQWIKDKEWKEGTTPYFIWMGNELNNKKVGFVGFGAVGKATAKILSGFGCKIFYYDPFVEITEKNYEKISLKEIFETSDIVSIHLPVNSTTKGLIDYSLLSLMKKGALFVNTARSAVVKTEDLIKILKEKRIKGAILDVLDNEPPKDDDLEIINLDNILLTPHICGASYEVTDHQADIVVERLNKWFNNDEMDKIIYNKDIL